MNKGKAVELHAVLRALGSQESPMRLTLARNLQVLAGVEKEFSDARNDKFQELVLLDKSGEPVLDPVAKKAVEEGRLPANVRLPFASYKYEDKDGAKQMAEFVEELQKEEVDVKLIPIRLQKQIKVGEEKMTLEEYLDSVECKIDSNALSLLLESGILV